MAVDLTVFQRALALARSDYEESRQRRDTALREQEAALRHAQILWRTADSLAKVLGEAFDEPYPEADTKLVRARVKARVRQMAREA